MNTVFDARMRDPIKRKDFAKIISEFAQKRFYKKIDPDKVCEFEDMDDQNAERQYYAVLACKL